MKLCAACQRVFEDDKSFCVVDGASLTFVRPGSLLIAEKYLLHRRIGRGGMGTVYAATHQDLERKVAVKLLLSEFMSDPHALERFRREARAAARINNQNVADLFDYGSLPDASAYIVMELVEGVTVRRFIDERQSVDITAAIEIVRQAALGVEAAHRRDIVHRDLKPSNIIITNDSEQHLLAKVLDFGIAKLREANAAGMTLTQHDGIVGTPRYMSPEQCASGDADLRSDIYSLGVILYELLARRVPFDAPTPTAIALKHIHDAPPPLENTSVEIPDKLKNLVMQTLDKNPAARPASAILFAETLRTLRAELPGISPDTLAYLKQRTDDAEELMRRSDTETSEIKHQTSPVGALTQKLGDATNSNQSHNNQVLSSQSQSFLSSFAATSSDIAALPPTVAASSNATPRAARPLTITIRSNEASLDSPPVAPVNTPFEIPREKTKTSPLVFAALAISTALLSGVGAFWYAAQNNKPDTVEQPAVAPLPESKSDAASDTNTARTTLQPTPNVTVNAPTASAKPKPSPSVSSSTPDSLDDTEAIRSSLNEWVAANNSRNVDAQMKFYPDTIQRYYLQQGVSRAAVRNDKARVFNNADSAKIGIGGVEIKFDQSKTNANVRFYKKYSINNAQASRQGTVLQEMQWTKTPNGWRITGERDVRVLN